LLLWKFLKVGNYTGGIALRCLLALIVFAFPGAIFAGSATWSSTPANGDWNTAGNWSAAGPPNGATDTATFGVSNTTGVSLSAATTVDSIVFNSGASAFTITTSAAFGLTMLGAGITNNSGITQNFVTTVDVGGNPGFLVFENSATAGTLTTVTNNANTVAFFGQGGQTEFHSTSTAGSGTFINNGGAADGAGGGETSFLNSADAGSGTFTSNGGTASGAFGGLTNFLNTSDGGTATFISNGGTAAGANGGVTNFGGASTAHAATLIANGGSNGGSGGTITFSSGGTGGTARVEVFGNGNLDIGLNNVGSGVTIGSLEGTGNVFLSNRNLTVGSNNMSTTFSGVIQDGGQGGFTGGSLTKIGSGTLSLTNANTFTGGTLINAGRLIAAHDGALGTGNVSLAASSVTLTLQNGATNNYISNSATLSIVSGATVNLNFTGAADVVSGLVLAGFSEAPGTYNASNEPSFFTGTGAITVVPEPSTWTMFSIGAAVLIGMRPRLRKRR
jgi:hypothetical protein